MVSPTLMSCNYFGGPSLHKDSHLRTWHRNLYHALPSKKLQRSTTIGLFYPIILKKAMAYNDTHAYTYMNIIDLRVLIPWNSGDSIIYECMHVFGWIWAGQLLFVNQRSHLVCAKTKKKISYNIDMRAHVPFSVRPVIDRFLRCLLPSMP